jgi:poly-beta-1,6-N-acetyl-D-glucosamine synthase
MTFVLVTPARNEDSLIGNLIESVIAQTVRPLQWIIVSDGSTDRTDEIVAGYARQHPWIELIIRSNAGARDFASKVHAFNAAYARLKDVKYDIIGNLDADITFERDYFSFLLSKFELAPDLGVAGTAFVEDGELAYNYGFTNIEHVSGGCQMFRRECFEAVGGFLPLKTGGEDWVAVTTARMHGWRTRTFTERHFVHHRKMGRAGQGLLKARYYDGRNDYLFGNHPAWQFFRVLYQSRNPLRAPQALAILLGYLIPWLSRTPRAISQELTAFAQQEQMRRLRSTLGKPFYRLVAPSRG